MNKILLIVISICCASLAFGQSSNQQLLDKLVQKNVLTAEEAKEIALETEKEEQAKEQRQSTQLLDKATSLLKGNKYMQIGGYALLHQSYSNTRDIKNQSAIRFAFLSMRGEPVKNLNYFVLYSLRHTELTEYNVTWKLSNALQFKAGQQKTLIALENQIGLFNLEFIQNAKMMDYLIGGGYDALALQNGKHNSGRDIGFKAFGELFHVNNRPILEYAVGMYQGSGINTGAKRNNKDFAANLLVSPFEGFRIGGGAYFGQAVYGIEGKLENKAHVRNRWVVSSDFKRDNVTARVEYAYGNDAGIKKEGIYGVGTWRFHPKFELLGKVEYYNHDKKVGNEFIDYGTGINFWFTKMCRIQANYTYTDYSRKWDAKNSHLVEGQLQIVF